MEIHYVTPGYFPSVGGVETHVRSLAQLANARGHRVTVHTRGTRNERAEDANIRIRRYRPLFAGGYYSVWFGPEVGGADLVHLHGYGFLPNDLAARRSRSRRVFYTLHHGLEQPRTGTGTRLKWSLYEDLWATRTLRLCTRVFPSSPADLPGLARRSIPEARVEVLPTGLPDTAFDDRSGTPPVHPPSDPFFLFLGRVAREKAVGDLLQAIARLPKPVSAVVAGPDGGDLARLQALMTQIGIADRVGLTGWVSEDVKRWLLDHCAAYVLPSEYEAQGVGIVEAWARSRPVIASNVGGVRFLVKDGVDGLLYPQGDVAALAARLQMILDDSRLSSSLGREGRQQAWSKFRLEILGSRVMDLYERAVL